MEHQTYNENIFFCMAKEFIEERLGLTVTFDEIESFAGYIALFEESLTSELSKKYGEHNDAYNY